MKFIFGSFDTRKRARKHHRQILIRLLASRFIIWLGLDFWFRFNKFHLVRPTRQRFNLLSRLLLQLATARVGKWHRHRDKWRKNTKKKAKQQQRQVQQRIDDTPWWRARKLVWKHFSLLFLVSVFRSHEATKVSSCKIACLRLDI